MLISDDRAKTQRITAMLILATVIAWAVWDALVYLRVGGVATISTTLGNWQSASWFLGAPIAVGMGVLSGHFLRMTPYPDAWQWLRWLLFAGGLAVGILMTRRP